MPVPTLAALGRELERVPHDERMRRMVDLGRLAESDQGAASLVDRLERGDPYQRLLVFHSVYGGRGEMTGARAVRALRDSSSTLRKRAVHVAALPPAERPREARRHLSQATLMGEPEKRLPYAAFLPWEEARAFLDPFLRNPEAERRALALTVLAGRLRFERDKAPEFLALVRARRNEQDPVRVAILRGLASVPPSIWRSEHLDDLATIIRDALDAADLSNETAGSAEALVVHLLPFHPEWAAEWLAVLAAERGQINFHGIERFVDDAAVRRLAPALIPVLRSWETREREAHLIAAAGSFGRRLRVFPELGEILERLARESGLPHTALRALANRDSGDGIPVLVAALDGDPLAAVLRARLGAAAFGGGDLVRALSRLAAADALHADALAAAVEALGASPSPQSQYGLFGHLGPFGPYGYFGPWGPSRRGRRNPYARANLYGPRGGYLALRAEAGKELDVVERELAASADARLRRLALAALEAQAGDSLGWTGERLERLIAFRADPSPLVAGAAQFTLPLAELEGPDGGADEESTASPSVVE